PCQLRVHPSLHDALPISSYSIQPSPCSVLWNMKTTGLSSRMAEIIMPLRSYGVVGATTFMPGIWPNVAYKVWECCAASLYPPPTAVINTIGTFTLPPDI